MNKASIFAVGLMAATALGGTAHADKLDDIIGSGTLRCAVVLDFPPMGSRDANNTPIGFDVDYCNDLAKALGIHGRNVEVIPGMGEMPLVYAICLGLIAV